MAKRLTILILAGLITFAGLSLPAAAQQEGWSIGGGYWTLPNVEDGVVDTSGIFACAVMRSPEYMLEVDYANDDPGFLALAADYLYPLGPQGNYFGGSGAIGIGYTYFSADDLENESGVNVIGVAEVGNSLFGTIRYDFLGSDQELLTIGITYSFY